MTVTKDLWEFLHRKRSPTQLRFYLTSTIIMLTILPIPAHHSVLPFDNTRGTEVHGVVTRFVWQNPHTHIYLNVMNHDKNIVEEWAIESESSLLLRKVGWTKDTVKLGDPLAVIGARAKNGARLMRCDTIRLKNGKSLTCLVPIAPVLRNK